MQGAKSGPDYIDPGFHAAATGRPGVNLDSWAMAPALLNSLASEAARDAELVFLESAMGLFDGIPGEPGRSGSAADLARLYGLPVLLVLDVSGQSQTAAAVAKGFAAYDPEVRIAGVVLNRLGSERHRRLAGDAIEALGLPVVGAILRDPTLNLPERHLGLVQAEEHADLMAHLDRLANVVERSLDLDAIMALMTPMPSAAADFSGALPPPGQRIALAQDAAFTFLYPHLASHWRSAGAEIVPFSPLADEAPPEDCDVCWLPGGYPELHAGKLAAQELPRRLEKICREKARPRRVRRLHGAGRSAGGCRRRGARNARPARPFDQFCQAQDEPRLPPGKIARGLPARAGGRGRPRPRIPLRADDRAGRRRGSPISPTARATPGRVRRTARPCHRHVLPCDSEG